MAPKIKKIIAREGLVLLPFFMFLMILMSTSNYMPYTYYNTLFLTILFGYPLTRFIIWATRTLKEKRDE